MKTLEVFIRMAFLLLKIVIFPQISAKWQQKFKFLEIILEFQPTKRVQVFQNLNHSSFVTWALTKNPEILRTLIKIFVAPFFSYYFKPVGDVIAIPKIRDTVQVC